MLVSQLLARFPSIVRIQFQETASWLRVGGPDKDSCKVKASIDDELDAYVDANTLWQFVYAEQNLKLCSGSDTPKFLTHDQDEPRRLCLRHLATGKWLGYDQETSRPKLVSTNLTDETGFFLPQPITQDEDVPMFPMNGTMCHLKHCKTKSILSIPEDQSGACLL